MRLHTKLILVLVPLLATPMAVLGWVAYTQQRAGVEVESTRQLGTLVDEISRHVTTRLDAARADVLLFGNSHILRRYMLVEDEAQRFELLQPSLLKLFASYQRANPEYYELRVLLPDGYEDTRATSHPIPNVTEEEAGTDYVRTMMKSPDSVLTQIVRNPDTGAPAAMISHRISLNDASVDPILAKPRLRGYLVATMSLEFLQEQADEIRVGSQGHLFFTDRTGRASFSPSGMDHGQGIPTSLLADFKQAARRQELLKTTHLGETHLIRGRELHPNLYGFVVLPEKEILASTRQLAYVTVSLILLSLLITATLLFGFLRSLLLSPLARLGQAAREIGLGEPVVDIGIRRDDEIGQLATSFEDMSRRLHHSHERIAHIAHHDSLTGLPNRRHFIQVLERALVQARRDDEVIGLLFLDLDDFKRVNDSLGHQAGDELLCEIADRLTSVVRPDDLVSTLRSVESHGTVSRLGGDEFIVLLPRLTEALNAAAVAGRILDRLGMTVSVTGTDLGVNASIGIAVFPQDGDSAEELIKNADVAMYHAKEQGKNHYQFFTRSLNTALVKRIVMESALRKALARKEFELHYQPQVNVHSGDLIGTEALIRWTEPELGSVSPGEFIPLAEEIGLIIPIGEWVLREACRQNKAWQDAGFAPVPVAVNISGRHLSGAGLENAVKTALFDSGLAARYLDIELTETSVMSSPDEAVETLSSLKEMGVRISMDDFGTGYSSLGLLKRLPIDTLKIDKSFVSDLTNDGDDATITGAIIAMAKSLNLDVIAEGVEQVSQLAFLRAHGCSQIQGFLISRPQPAGDMTPILRDSGVPLSMLTSAAGAKNEHRLLRAVEPRPAG